jgi:hypothetical protein
MRKLILAGMAVAVLAVPAVSMATASVASADVARYQKQTATFTVTQPAGAYHQWDNVWTHSFTNVTVNPCDSTFSGNGVVSGADQNGPYTANETVTGSFGNGTVSFTATREDGLVTTLSNARTGDLSLGAPTTIASLSKDGQVVNTPDAIEMKVSQPEFHNTSSFKNHGDYVSSQGGGSDAAHLCIGMPIH